MKTEASSDDAPFLETEIAAAAGSRHTDDDVIYQMQLQYSAAFENSPGEAHIRLRRRRVSAYAACGITGVGLNRFAVCNKAVSGDRLTYLGHGKLG
jgi:hypothetical protein